MKKVGLFLLAVVVVAGLVSCGGGGDDKLSSECSSYCDYTCAKAANCGFYPANQLEICADTCKDEIDDNKQDCQNAFVGVSLMTCNDLGELLGFRSTAGDFGLGIGRFCSE